MKIKAADADRFLAAPPSHIAAVLIYGPDEGLVRERARAVLTRLCGDPPDPLRASDLTEAVLKADPARLADEAAALSLVPGARAVHVRLGGDGAARIVQAFLKDVEAGALKPDAFVVIEAGDLGPRSALRKAAEEAPNAGSVPCYTDDARAIAGLVRASLKDEGLGIEPAALDLLTQRLGADRGVSRQEIEKLALYKGSSGGTVTLDDVEACLPADMDNAADMLADQVAGGDLNDFDRAYGRALQTGLPAAALLRGVALHFQNLHQWTSAIAAGAGLDDTLRRARPPVHFKRQDRIKAQLGLWSPPDVETALTALSEAERQSKSTGLPDALIGHRTLLSLARRAERQKRRRGSR